jgi:hypothetical protein
MGLFVGACDSGDVSGGTASTGVQSMSSTSAPPQAEDQAAPSSAIDPALAGVVEAIGKLRIPRAAHTATRLIDGRVLFAGGCTQSGCEGNDGALAAEIFDPAVGGFVDGPPMTVPRAGHTATLLPDGTVLLVGGYDGERRGPLASAELFDPLTNEFMPTGEMAQPRGSHTATALEDGRVLVVGGENGPNQLLDSAEIFDPLTGTFTTVAPLPDSRAGHGAVRVGSGEVLVIGGRSVESDVVTGTTVLYDPATDHWSPSGELHEARHKHAVVPLSDGSALVIGGSDQNDFRGRLTSLERWSPASGAWTHVADLREARFKIPEAVALLSDGRVVIAGDEVTPEVYDPRTNRLDSVQGALETAALFATATALADDHVLIAGGYDDNIAVLATAYVYQP